MSLGTDITVLKNSWWYDCSSRKLEKLWFQLWLLRGSTACLEACLQINYGKTMRNHWNGIDCFQRNQISDVFFFSSWPIDNWLFDEFDLFWVDLNNWYVYRQKLEGLVRFGGIFRNKKQGSYGTIRLRSSPQKKIIIVISPAEGGMQEAKSAKHTGDATINSTW